MRCWRRGVAWPRKLAHLEDQVPLGALLADLREFDEADQVYCDALRGYRDVSPFALAWVCFQLGVLWGESVPERQLARAERCGIDKPSRICPSYVKARVHLAEIYSGLSAGPATRRPCWSRRFRVATLKCFGASATQ